MHNRCQNYGRPVMRPLRAFMIVAFVASLAPAVETKDADVRAALGKVHAQAVKENDLWTALQCESYGAKNRARLTPALGNCDIIGEPLFAFPTELLRVLDAGSKVLVATRHALHVLAPDGRPLAVSVRHAPLQAAEVAAFSMDGQVMGVAQGAGVGVQAMVVVRDLASGAERWRATVAPLANRTDVTFTNLEAAVSCDGSAFIGTLGSGVAAFSVLVHANGTAESLLNVFRARAIGPKGAWIIAYHNPSMAKAISPESRLFLRLAKDQRYPIKQDRGYASRRDHAVVLMSLKPAQRLGVVGKAAPPLPEEDEDLQAGVPIPVLVAPDGTCKALRFSFNLGAQASIYSVGDYLVVNSGLDAESRPEVDLLGQEVKPTGRQPALFALYSWESIIRDGAQAIPAVTGQGNAVFCPTLPATFYWARGNELMRVDMSQDPPVERALGTFGQRITSLTARDSRLQISTDAGQIITTQDGLTLWSGPSQVIPRLNGPLWMTVEQLQDKRRTFSAVYLGSGANDRRPPVPLPSSFDPTWAFVDPYGRFASVHGAGELQVQYNLSDGKAIRPALDPVTNSHRYSRDFIGRFGQYGTRLYNKLQPWPDGAKGEWMVRDGLVSSLNGGILILDELSQVWTGRRPGPYQNLGVCPGAYRIMATDNEILLLNQSSQVVGRFVNGKLLNQAPVDCTAMQNETPGAWRLEEGHTTFMPPRINARLRWSELNRIVPLTFHSLLNSNSPLTVVTPSLVLGIDNTATTLRQCAKPQ